MNEEWRGAEARIVSFFARRTRIFFSRLAANLFAELGLRQNRKLETFYVGGGNERGWKNYTVRVGSNRSNF